MYRNEGPAKSKTNKQVNNKPLLSLEVKWALGSITTHKASGCDGIPVELLQILKDDAALNMSANLENSSGATVLKKSQFSFQSQRRAMSKNVSTSVQL